MSKPPDNPKIYHIMHADCLASVINDGRLLSDAIIQMRADKGTVIGMNEIKQRRLSKPLTSFPNITVGQCVPFYFCPRSVMLFVIHSKNHPSLDYRGGQESIIHLELDLKSVADWAQNNGRSWLFTLSNAGSYYFEERRSLDRLGEINWQAIQAEQWNNEYKEPKQAEFLVENEVPFSLVERIGTISLDVAYKVNSALMGAALNPTVEVMRSWYY